ncbi:GNAT family N-acetyltransferase [soil metagenome]
MNDYLKQRARQHQEKRFATTWVAVEEGQTRVLGYLSLAMGSVIFEHADPEVFRGLPRHPMPVLHVARLATDLTCQGKGIGSFLLGHAADVAIAASESMGVYALELLAVDVETYDYYLRRGFLPLQGESMRLYAPVATLLAGRNPTP